jgi:HAD superfamily hydrolase (TIGR01509 family)
MPQIGVIFDWDGVVINSANPHEESWLVLADEINHALPINHFKNGFGKRNETIIGNILKWSDNSDEIIKWGIRKEEIYRELANQQMIKMVPGTIEILDLLKKNKVPTAIETSTEKKNVALAIKQNQLDEFFTGAIYSEDVSKGKPHPEVFLKAAKTIRCYPKNCIVFEDSTHGIEAAIRARMNPVGITTTNTKSRLLKKGAKIVVDRLDEIDLSILEDLIKSAKE